MSENFQAQAIPKPINFTPLQPVRKAKIATNKTKKEFVIRTCETPVEKKSYKH